MSHQDLEADTSRKGTEYEAALAIQFNEQQDFEPNVVRDVQSLVEVPPTGWWDDATVAAIARFQAANALEADGHVGPATFGLFREAWAARAAGFGALGFDLPASSTLAEGLNSAVLAAENDWRAGTSEADLSSNGRLAAIFKDSGWSIYGVDKNPAGKPLDWCGMAVASWLKRAGMDPDHRKTFFATSNVLSFFTYSRQGVTHRTMKKVAVDGGWRLLERYHEQQGGMRSWCDFQAVRKSEPGALDLRPGDVVLINHKGQTDGAHHITMVHAWNSPILETIEGNASGTGPDGEARKQAVVVNRRDLSSAVQRNKIFGIGRLCESDFRDLKCV